MRIPIIRICLGAFAVISFFNGFEAYALKLLVAVVIVNFGADVFEAAVIKAASKKS